MGLFTDHYKTSYKEHTIEIEARVISFLGTAQYDLIVDNKRIDRIEGLHGKFTLRGFLDETEAIEVRIKQCLGTKYHLYIDGQPTPIAKA